MLTWSWTLDLVFLFLFFFLTVHRLVLSEYRINDPRYRTSFIKLEEGFIGGPPARSLRGITCRKIDPGAETKNALWRA